MVSGKDARWTLVTLDISFSSRLRISTLHFHNIVQHLKSIDEAKDKKPVIEAEAQASIAG